MKSYNKSRKKGYLLLLFVLASTLLTGCGVSQRNKEKLFQSLKKEHFIDVGEADFEEYTSIDTVSNAPVPGYSSYYTYDTPDRSYRICYEGYAHDEYDKAYRVSVEEITDDVREHICYYFYRTKIFKKMKWFDTKHSYYEKMFEEKNEYGINKFRQSGSDIYVLIPEDKRLCEDGLLFTYVEEILEHPENAPKIICTIGGEDYEAEDVRVYEQGDEYVISGEVDQAEKEEIESWQFGEVFLKLR